MQATQHRSDARNQSSYHGTIVAHRHLAAHATEDVDEHPRTPLAVVFDTRWKIFRNWPIYVPSFLMKNIFSRALICAKNKINAWQQPAGALLLHSCSKVKVQVNSFYWGFIGTLVVGKQSTKQMVILSYENHNNCYPNFIIWMAVIYQNTRKWT